jgi:DNA repair exonuclease SbcCD nuclease subunit
MKKDFSHAKRCWMLTDLHFGVRSNSQEWQDIQDDYFNKFFIPLVKKNYKPGDVLLILGDIFDSRNSINLKVLCMGVDIFEKLSEIFKDGIIIILGNHDIWARTNNEINSLKSIKWIPNIFIYEEPETLQIGQRKFLLMPWRKDHEAENECVETKGAGHDYLLCHADIQGLKFNKFTDITEGCNIDNFDKFKTVYSGHIHYAQKIKNVNMLGSPYQLTRSDIGNTKGVTLLDLDTQEETYWENNYSPKFIKLKFTDVIEMSPKRLNQIFKNNFIDIYIDGEQALKAPINLFMDLLDGSYRRIDFHPLLGEQEDMALNDEFQDTNFDLLKFAKEYVDTLPFEDDTKTKLYDFVFKLYHKTEQQIYQQM